MRSYTVTKYEMDDYENARNNMSDSEAVELLNRIDRGYIPDYSYTGQKTILIILSFIWQSKEG